MCDSLEENSWKFAPGFLWTSAHVPYPFVYFALYLFAIINHSHILSPPNKPLYQGVVLGTPTHPTFLPVADCYFPQMDATHAAFHMLLQSDIVTLPTERQSPYCIP